MSYPTLGGSISHGGRYPIDQSDPEAPTTEIELSGAHTLNVSVVDLTDETYGDSINLELSLEAGEQRDRVEQIFGFSTEGVFDLKYLHSGRYRATLECGERPLGTVEFDVPGPDVEVHFAEPSRVSVILPEEYEPLHYSNAADTHGFGPRMSFFFVDATKPRPSSYDEWRHAATFRTSERTDIPVRLLVPPGNYHVGVYAAGYAIWTRTLLLEEDQTVEFRVPELTRLPREH